MSSKAMEKVFNKVVESNNSPYIVSKRISSIEELGEEAERWYLDFKKISPGEFQADLKLIDIGIIQLSEIKMKGVILQNGASPEDYKTIIVAGDEMQSYKWQNYDITSELLMVTPLDNHFSSITNDNFHVYTIAIHNDYLKKLIADFKLDTLERKFKNEEILYPINKNYLLLLNSYIRVLFNEFLAKDNVYVHNKQFTKIIKKLPEILLGYLNEQDAVMPDVKYRKTDDAALKFCEVYDCSPVPDMSIKDFCLKYDIKQKTLETAINEYFGLSPIAFVKAIKLNFFRRELFANYSSVSEVALKCGFTHLGQMAKDYRKLFGELPSDTVRKISKGSKVERVL